MEEPREHDGREQTEPMKEKAEGEAGETIEPSIPAASAPPRWWGIGGWALFVVALLFALFLAVELWRERQQMAALTEEANRLREAVASARRVFLERAVAELGYASVDLQADPPKRYQVTFRLDEASRWLRDAKPLLSENGQTQVQSILPILRQLPVLVEQDPVNARQELAKVQDTLERLIKAETHAR